MRDLRINEVYKKNVDGTESDVIIGYRVNGLYCQESFHKTLKSAEKEAESRKALYIRLKEFFPEIYP